MFFLGFHPIFFRIFENARSFSLAIPEVRQNRHMFLYFHAPPPYLSQSG